MAARSAGAAATRTRLGRRRGRGRARRRGRVRRHADRSRTAAARAGPAADPSDAATHHNRYRDTTGPLEPGTATGCSSASTTPASRSTPASPSTARSGHERQLPGGDRQRVATAACAVYRPMALAAGSGCLGDDAEHGRRRDPAVARAAARPAPAEHGPPGAHTRAGVRPRRRPPAAADRQRLRRRGVPRRRDDPRRSRHHLRRRPQTVVIDFWVVDVGGVPVVVDTWHQDDASTGRPLPGCGIAHPRPPARTASARTDTAAGICVLRMLP